jgi:hypothetical protein
MGMVDLRTIDDTLDRLRAACDAIGANLLELERDPNRKLLETAALSGETAARWAEVQGSLGNLWQSLTRLNDLVERADAARGPKTRISSDRVAALDLMLHGPSIELPAEQIPLAQRDLVDDHQVGRRCTPDELLARMSSEFEQTLAVVVAVGNAWDTLVPRLRAARATFDDAVATASDIGDDSDTELDAVGHELATIADRVAGDPLSVNAADFDRVDAGVASLRDGMAAARQLRDEVSDRLARARSSLDELRAAVRAAVTAHDEAILKIVDPNVPAPGATDRGLADELDAVVASSERGDWRGAAATLAIWTTRVEASLRATHECAAANRAPIEARNELRGRLDAYRGMAHVLGLLEDPEATERYERAHHALYNAPTDLDEADELVRCYQDALSTRRPEREELR